MLRGRYLLALIVVLPACGDQHNQDRAARAMKIVEGARGRFKVFDEQYGRSLPMEVTGDGFRSRTTTADIAASGTELTSAGRWREPGARRLTSALPARTGDVLRLSSGPVTLAIRAIGGRRVAGVLAHRSVVYADAYPGADSMLQVELDRVEEFIVLRDGLAPRQFQYEVKTIEGGGAVRQREGVVEALDQHGIAWLRLAPPYVIDGSGKRHPAEARLHGDRLTLKVPDAATAYPVLVDPGWTVTGKLVSARRQHTATLLYSGKVLIAGGGTNTAELYDPGTATWTTTASMKYSRKWIHTATLLPSGKVLVTGGAGDTSTAEVYDPASGKWSTVAPMSVGRRGHAAVWLPTGVVLVAGGRSTATAALYNPLTNKWTATGSMTAGREGFGMVRLNSGEVLAAGGASSPSAEVYDAKAGKWTSVGALTAGKRADLTVTLLKSGRVLMAGGYNSKLADIYDPAANKITRAADMITQRYIHTATLLPSGAVLVVGGRELSSIGQPVAKAELYDEKTGKWSAAGSMPDGHMEHTATLLNSGLVLVAGGVSLSGSAKLYDPTSGAACTKASSCASGYCVDGVCCESPCQGTCGICVKQTGAAGTHGKCSWIGAGKPDLNATVPCASGGLCDGKGVCLKGNGVKCTAAHECGSGYCVDGVCCADACTGTCKGCAVKGHLGACWELSRNAQDSLAKIPCVGTKACDGVGSCRGNFGATCAGNTDCASDLCVDKTCCRTACTGVCRSCALANKRGTCSAIAKGTDPQGECLGTDPKCGGACDGKLQCDFPSVGKSCGGCKACDGTGKCSKTPPDDPSCGVIDCDKLDTKCRDYLDLVGNRCDSFGACKKANDPTSCSKYTTLACGDAGPDVGSADARTSDRGAAPDSRPPGPGPDQADTGCSYAVASGGGLADAWFLALLALAALGARSRSRRRARQPRWTLLAAAALVLGACTQDPGPGTRLDRGPAETGLADQRKPDTSPPAGSAGGPCYPNDTCNKGLVCVSKLCVRIPDAGPEDTGPGDHRGHDGPAVDAAATDLAGKPDASTSPDMFGTLPACASPGQPCTLKHKCALQAVCGADKLCHPTKWTDCDDGLSCTADSCLGQGVCSNVPQAGSCALVAPKAGKYVTQCFGKGAVHPANPCLVCAPAQGKDGGAATGGTSWSPRTGGACDDGILCTKGDSCVAGICAGTDYSAKCSDGLWCTKDMCDGKGGCAKSQVMTGWCAVNGGCFKHAAKNPAAQCSYCDTASSQTSWTKLPNRCQVGYACVASGQQHPGGCAQCVPSSNPAGWSVKGTHCLINDACVSSGASNPADVCFVCDPAKSATGWTKVSQFCVINGKCYRKGDLNSGGCAQCDPAVSSSKWTVKGDHCLINNVCKKPKDKGVLKCSECDPARDKYGWSTLSGYCLILGSCYSNGDLHGGKCAKCDPAVSVTDWTVPGNHCLIHGFCHKSGQQDLSGCAKCDPAADKTAWTPLADRCKIDGMCHAAGAAQPQGCGTCDPTKSKYNWSPSGSGCVIDFQCHASGVKHPAGCASCDPTKSKTAWTVAGSGCIVGDACFANGTAEPGGCGVCDSQASKVSWTKSSGCLATFGWSRALGDKSSDYVYGVGVDAQHNVYVGGYFYGSASYKGLNLGGKTLKSNGSYDIFLASYTPAGVHRWSRSFGHTSSDYLYDLAVDNAGNVYLTGSFYNSINLGGSKLFSKGSADVFLASFTPDGKHRWSRGFGDLSSDHGYGVAVDVAGNVYITGYFYGSTSSSYKGINFGGSTLKGKGSNDIFIASFSSSGIHRWSSVFGGINADRGYDVAVDAAGNSYVTGSFSNSADFGGGAITSRGVLDIFLASFTPAGAHRWSRGFGDKSPDLGYGVAVDNNSNVYITGQFRADSSSSVGGVSFGGAVLKSNGSGDIFVASFTSVGAHRWSKNWGGAGADTGHGVATDSSNNVYLTGAASSGVTFGGGALKNMGGADVFVASFTSVGAHRWSRSHGDTSDDYGRKIATAPDGSALVTGYFYGSSSHKGATFGGATHKSKGAYDVFLLKLTP